MTTVTLQEMIGKSLFWGLVAGATCFVAIFISSFYYGGNLGPFGGILGGIFYSPVAFVMGAFLAGLCQIRRVKTLPARSVVGYGLFLALLLSFAPVFLLFPSSVARLIFG